MSIRRYLLDIYNVLNQDETLLRLLHYKPENALDDPLDSNKPNIVESDIHWTVVESGILHAPRTDDLEADKPICRIAVYLGARSNTRNIKVSNQHVVVDVFTHIRDFEIVDLRSAWIIDRLDELLQGERITGIGKFESSRADNIYNAPNGYLGYRLVYTFGSVKK